VRDVANSSVAIRPLLYHRLWPIAIFLPAVPCCLFVMLQAPAGSPPDVSARLLHACDIMAAESQQRH